MPRRYRPPKRKIEPDIKYNSVIVAKFINRLMKGGKKSQAARILYDAFDIIEARMHRNPLDVFEQAIKNATPILEVKPRRVGGATYQVPVEVPPDRQLSLAMRWLTQSARNRPGKSMAEKLANELIDAAQGTGATIKKREDTHKMAEANKAFAHYRW
ncbi:MAG: 30S ribosomal protein S7 [Chloroflexi bacterium]|nr:30S ribosomal protein S7 [Anaerolineae bacterium]RLC74198.1 MAG: 30S ribosomal protein S7 [Chloroflexota bacterium]